MSGHRGKQTPSKYLRRLAFDSRQDRRVLCRVATRTSAMCRAMSWQIPAESQHIPFSQFKWSAVEEIKRDEL